MEKIIGWLEQEIANCEQWIDYLASMGRHNEINFYSGERAAFKEVLTCLTTIVPNYSIGTEFFRSMVKNLGELRTLIRRDRSGQS